MFMCFPDMDTLLSPEGVLLSIEVFASAEEPSCLSSSSFLPVVQPFQKVKIFMIESALCGNPTFFRAVHGASWVISSPRPENQRISRTKCSSPQPSKFFLRCDFFRKTEDLIRP